MIGAQAGEQRAPRRAPPASLVVPGVTGVVGSVCILLGASQPGSPFTLDAAGAWFFGNAPGAQPVGTDARFLGIVLVYLGMVLMLGSWYEIVRTVRSRPGTPVVALVRVLVAWAVPVLVCAPLFSGDVYSYAAQGQMVTKGISPYAHGPDALGGGGFLHLVDPLWRHAPAPYGPAWERLSGWIVQLAGHDTLASVVGFRVVAVVGVTLLAVFVPVLARSVGRDPAAAFALAVLNPLVLLALLGGAHNDALMVGLLVAACAVARKKHVFLGLVLCALAAEVKIPALIGAVYIGWWWAGAAADRRRRGVRVGLAVGFTAGLMAVMAAASGLGWRWVTGLSNPGRVVSWLDPATGVGLLLSHAANVVGLAVHQTTWVDGARLAALVVAAVISVGLLLRSDGHGALPALGWSLLAVVFLGPVVWPWYETWGLVFLAVVAEGWSLRVVFLLSVLACLADVPRPGLLVSANPLLVALLWAALAAVIGVYVSRRLPAPSGAPRRSSAV